METQPLHEAAQPLVQLRPGRFAPTRERPTVERRDARMSAAPTPRRSSDEVPAQRVLQTSPVSPKPSACLVASVRSNSRPAT